MAPNREQRDDRKRRRILVGPGIPEPHWTPGGEGVFATVKALKEAVEVLQGIRPGSVRDSAITWQDLVDRGIIEELDLPADIQAGPEPKRRNR